MEAKLARAAPAVPPITDDEFRLFCDFFYHRTGIHFVESKRFYVDRRLLDRVRASGQTSFAGYLSLLRRDSSSDEIQALINELTVNETYFFREKNQFDCLVNSVLPELTESMGRDPRTIRIWIVPCSTGEEAYSIALYLLEYWPGIEKYDVEIVASDIDTGVLKKCEVGVYSPRSVDQLPKPILSKYFAPTGQGTFEISRDLVEAVKFCRVNLVEPESTRRFRGFDIVFCRNLFIYFDEVSRRRGSQGIFDALRPGGTLFLGQMESIGKVSGLFEVERKPEGLIYRRPR